MTGYSIAYLNTWGSPGTPPPTLAHSSTTNISLYRSFLNSLKIPKHEARQLIVSHFFVNMRDGHCSRNFYLKTNEKKLIR